MSKRERQDAELLSLFRQADPGAREDQHGGDDGGDARGLFALFARNLEAVVARDCEVKQRVLNPHGTMWAKE